MYVVLLWLGKLSKKSNPIACFWRSAVTAQDKTVATLIVSLNLDVSATYRLYSMNSRRIGYAPNLAAAKQNFEPCWDRFWNPVWYSSARNNHLKPKTSLTLK